MKEIGSEFWSETNKENIYSKGSDDSLFLLSGRTAIDFIIRDIKSSKSFKKVMLPSYCCESVIEPFFRNGVEVIFYSVKKNSVSYNFSNDADAVFVLDYFGFTNDKMSFVAEKESANGKIVIYDSTHMLKANTSLEKYSDYIFTSYRKWYFSSFAGVKKLKGEFNISAPDLTQENYISLRKEAADLKKKYIENKLTDKNKFLNLFSQAEEILDKDYQNYFGVPVWQNFDKILEARKENALILINELKSIGRISLWKENIEENDAPMFVPIFMEESKRNELRNFLISNGVYCPIHWPLTNFHNIKKEDKQIYKEELSLVCDQRYSKEDMLRQTALVKKFFEEV